MIRDVLIASINKGQFPLGIFGIIMIILALRLPSEEISKLAWAILNDVKQGQMIGNILFLITLGGWLTHARWQRKNITLEMKRVSDQRNQLQKELGLKIKSSEGKQ